MPVNLETLKYSSDVMTPICLLQRHLLMKGRIFQFLYLGEKNFSELSDYILKSLLNVQFRVFHVFQFSVRGQSVSLFLSFYD